MKPNLRLIVKLLGLLLSLNAIFMLFSIPVAIIYGEDYLPIAYSALITLSIGFPVLLFSRKKQSSKELKRRDGYLVVTLGWIVMSLSGTLPYIMGGSIPDFTNAFFETMSGYTTTGSTILSDIEALPKSILFWRSLTQWIGGMGIIVLAVAILPLLGIGGMQLFMAESPGITPDKFKPRIKDAAKRLWLIYFGLTLTEIILLFFGGMNLYDAITHSLTTMASGGFSPKQASIGFYTSPFIQYVIIFFMILAGTNFTLIYFFLKGRLGKLFSNEELKFYIVTIIVFTAIGTLSLVPEFSNFEESFRSVLFTVVSILTTTGYTVVDYMQWNSFLVILILALMFVGGSAGSTAGGVKVIRHVILFKNSFLEMKRLLHPSAIIPVRINDKAVAQDITYNVIGFIMIYFLSFALGTLIMGLLGTDFMTSIGAVAATLGNVGPGIGDVGPSSNYGHLPLASKWFLSFLMLIGRLELFTVLILFTPYFWRKQ